MASERVGNLTVVDEPATFPAVEHVRRRGRPFLISSIPLWAFCVVLAVSSHVGRIIPVVMIVIGGLYVVFGAALTIGYARTEVAITSSTVSIHNLWDVEPYAFDEIAGFELHPQLWPGTLLRLTPREHGIPRSQAITALSPGFRGPRWHWTENAQIDKASLQTIIDAMNAELDRRRGGTPTAERLAAAHPTFKSVGWADKD